MSQNVEYRGHARISQTIQEFIEKRELVMTAEPAPENPNMSDMPEGSQHYYCVFTKSGRTYSTYYSVGPGIVEHWVMRKGARRAMGEINYHKSMVPGMRARAHGHKYRPEIADVLDCLASDVSSYDNSAGFADWAGDFGYDTDSIKALATFNAVGESYLGLKSLLGNEAMQELMYEVERL